jgi:type II secretion system protein C
MNEKRFMALLWAAKAGLLVVLVYLAFEVATNRLHLGSVFDPGTASGEPQAGDPQATMPETRAPSDYAEIVKRNLFTDADSAGRPREGLKPLPARESVDSAQELSLRLIGALAGGSIASRAVIQDTRSNTTESYRIGDTVASATVEAIRRDAVVLQYQGQPLVLKLQAGTTAGNPSKASGSNGKSDSGKDKPASAKEPGSGDTGARTTTPRDHAGGVTDIFRKAKIEPYVKGGRTEGLKITGLDNIPMAGMFGFQDGDIVQSVNGQQLTSKQKAFQVLMKAKTQPKIDIQLLRDGKSKSLSFNL